MTQKTIVYAVIYSGYEEGGLDSLWTSEERAEERAREANKNWQQRIDYWVEDREVEE